MAFKATGLHTSEAGRQYFFRGFAPSPAAPHGIGTGSLRIRSLSELFYEHIDILKTFSTAKVAEEERLPIIVMYNIIANLQKFLHITLTFSCFLFISLLILSALFTTTKYIIFK
ncbi:hypothetical protein ACQRD6_10685 [Prevotella sp. SGI.027]